MAGAGRCRCWWDEILTWAGPGREHRAAAGQSSELANQFVSQSVERGLGLAEPSRAKLSIREIVGCGGRQRESVVLWCCGVWSYSNTDCGNYMINTGATE